MDISKKAKAYSAVHYTDYLQLSKILNAQHIRSKELDQEAHDEHLFIIVHQVYELWFKQIIHELGSFIDLFERRRVDDGDISIVVSRLDRVIEIQELLIKQIRVMETMTPLDFLDFRKYLFPASGFQSMQFRVVEVLLGLKSEKRLTYNNIPYHCVFSEKEQEELEKLETGSSILEVVEAWLERIPFLKFKGFNFLEQYKKAVDNMHQREREAIQATTFLEEHEKQMRIQILNNTAAYFESVLDEKHHAEMRAEGKLNLSYKATIGALLINLYRDEPILQMPFNLLTRLVDMDELLTTWRYRHAQMVLRMLGKKMGTGGSSGHDYLRKTAEKHGIFIDFHNISTLLIPRSELPPLPANIKKELGFYFAVNNEQ